MDSRVSEKGERERGRMGWKRWRVWGGEREAAMESADGRHSLVLISAVLGPPPVLPATQLKRHIIHHTPLPLISRCSFFHV